MGQWNPSILGQVAALVTIAGAGIYLLGLVALAWPIYSRVARGPAVTLFALSRIPRLMVAGFGLRIFRVYPLRIALASALSTVISLAIGPGAKWIYAQFLGSGNSSEFLPNLTPVTGVVVTAIVLLIAFIRVGRQTISESFRAHSTGPSKGVGSRGPLLTVSLIGTLAFLLLLFGVAALYAGAYFSGLVSILLGLLLTGVPSALLAYPPLPQVEITRLPIVIAGQGLSRTVKGRLLDHNSGSWYLFDERGTLIAISDSQVEEARIYEGE
jgi:hypothetical protein